MDRVRFGRALGYGARHAAKAFLQAADAATAPETSRESPPARPESTPQSRPTRQQTYSPPRPAAAAPAAVANAKRASKSFLHPVKRYSGTVLLQVVGTFFAVFALLMAQTAWKLRNGLHEPWKSPDAQHLWLILGLFATFAWFAVSSFLRARRLERS